MGAVGDAGPDRWRERRRPRRRARALTDPGCLRVRVARSGGDVDPDLVVDGCWALGATAVGELPGGTLEVGFESGPDARIAAEQLLRVWPELQVEEVDARPALEAALDAWKPFARPVRVGRLHVRPSWLSGDDEPPSADEVAVVVNPSRAFGYDHPSTVLCLAEIDARVHPGSRVLDVGCGSGVLAIAAARLGADPVVAIDREAAAVDATRRGAAANGVSVEVSDHPVGEEERRFDLVLANIGAATLTALAAPIAASVDDGGTLVLAGLLVQHVDAVAAAYAGEGLALVATAERSGWASPVFQGKSTT